MKYSTALNPPFTIGQVSDLIKTAFDALGWGTGKVNIQGGYRFTAQQAADAAAAPIQVKPDGTVIAPASIPNLTGCSWVDNFSGKNLVYPSKNTYYRWPLLFWLPGLKAFRIRFTPLYRPAGGSSGNFSDINFRVVEATYNNNPTNVSNQGRAASLNNSAWGSTYTVGQQYVTNWSHGSGGAFSDSAQIATAALIYCQNVVLRIDALEYLIDDNAFGVQSPNLDGPVHEFRFLDGSGSAYACMRPIPVKNGYQPRVLLMPPLLLNDHSLSSPQNLRLVRLSSFLFNYYRDDALSDTGLCNDTLPTFAVLKNYSYGSTLNLFAANNPDYRGFFLRISQSGKSTFALASDRVNKSLFPTNTLTIPERQEQVRPFADPGLINYETALERVGWLIRVEGQARTLSNVRIDGLYYPGTATYTLALYAVSKSGSSLTYNSKVADLPLVGDNNAYGSASGSFNLSLAPGYYLLVPPALPQFLHDRLPVSQHPLSSGVRLLGPVICRDLSNSSGWTPGSTVLNLDASRLSLVGNNAALHGSTWLSLNFLNMDTPTASTGVFAEGTAFVSFSPASGGGANNLDYDVLVLDNGSGSPEARIYGLYGAALPFGLSRALSSVEPGAIWQISPLPGWMAGQQSNYLSQANPVVEFASDVTSPFAAWIDRPYRSPLPLFTLRVRSEASVPSGGSYVNPDNSEDVVFSRHFGDSRTNYQRSLCFRLTP